MILKPIQAGWRFFLGDPLKELANPPKNQLAELDFLRCCAVLLVIATHVAKAYLSAGGVTNFFSESPIVRGGRIGVDLFFVLSGFLIGRQLWNELQSTGTIRIGRFVLRRGIRIWPLYVFFLVFVIAVLGRGDFPYGKWWSDALFITNYKSHGVVMGSWSLCSEEQFYVLAPLLLVLFATGIRSLANCRKYLIALLVALPVVRAVIWFAHTDDFSYHDPALFARILYTPLHTHSDGLVMGMLIANLLVTEGEQWKRVQLASWWVIGVTLLIHLALKEVQREVFDATGCTLFFGSLMLCLLANSPVRFIGMFRLPFFVFSRLSFGMYLNHEYLQDPIARFGMAYVPFGDAAPAMHHIVVTLLTVVVSLALALISYCFIEHPFLRLRGVAVDAPTCSLHRLRVSPRRGRGSAADDQVREIPAPVRLAAVRADGG